jgi:hypothetical protein
VAPRSIRFWDNSPEYPELVYAETVGPDQPFSFRWVFNASQSEQAVRDAAARAEESLKPAPPASSPPPAPPAPEPVRCRVPRLRKHLLRIAVGRIERANCRVGTVRKVYRKHRVTRRRHGKKVRVRVPYRRGTVLAQRPRPGTLLPDDPKVDMVVQGRRPHRHRRRRRH